MSNIYCNKRSIVEAVQWTGDGFEELDKFFCGLAYTVTVTIKRRLIICAENNKSMSVALNHYILKGLKGEFYTCRKDTFEELMLLCNDPNVMPTNSV